MSHATGRVYRDGRIVGWYEYDGTSDVVLTRIRDTAIEVSENWRRDNMARCTCGKPPVDVILYTNYGNGYHWPGKACLDCKAITDGTHLCLDDWIETTDGLPPGAETFPPDDDYR